MSAPLHHRTEVVSILIRLQTRRSRGIHFPWSESPALHLLNLFLAITGKMIPDPICTQRDQGRSACTHKPSICLEWPTSGTLAQTVTQLWGNTSVQPVTWYVSEEGNDEQRDRCRSLIFLSRDGDDAILGWWKGKPQGCSCGNKNASIEDKVSNKQGCEDVCWAAASITWEGWCRWFQGSTHLYERNSPGNGVTYLFSAHLVLTWRVQLQCLSLNLCLTS